VLLNLGGTTLGRDRSWPVIFIITL